MVTLLAALVLPTASALLATRSMPASHAHAQRSRLPLMQEAVPPTASDFELLRFENAKLKAEVGTPGYRVGFVREGPGLAHLAPAPTPTPASPNPNPSQVLRLLEATDPRAVKSRIEKATSLLTAEEERELKLQVGTNWPPRTMPQEGEGYIFFQGPTPKTGKQPELPSFLEDLKQAQARFAGLNTVPKALIGTAAALSFVLFIVLIIPTGPTPTYAEILSAAPPPPPAA